MPLSFGKAETAAAAREELRRHMTELEAFYLPYDRLLQERAEARAVSRDTFGMPCCSDAR